MDKKAGKIINRKAISLGHSKQNQFIERRTFNDYMDVLLDWHFISRVTIINILG